MTADIPSHAPESTYVHSRGVRIHVQVQGPRNAPLVLLIHGFAGGCFDFSDVMTQLSSTQLYPEQLRVAAVDLRGYGRSDKTPRGYDLTTAASDMAGVIRGLGYVNALVVGHGYGGLVAWTLAAHEPERVRGIITLSSAHPIVQTNGIVGSPLNNWNRASRILGAQLPRVTETRLVKDDAAHTERLFRSAVGPGFRDTDAYRKHARWRRDAMQASKVAHLSREYQRWLFRVRLRPEGIIFNRSFPDAIAAPVLAVEGSMDPGYNPRITEKSLARSSHESTDSVLLYGVGHYPHIEDPQAVAELISQRA